MSMLHGGFGASGSYTIANSVRLRASASASFSRTPGVAGNSKLLCGRFRIKRGTLGALQVIASAGTSSIDRFYFDSSDRLCLDVLGTTRLVTTAVYRDPSAHYVDVGFQLDVANGTAALRAKILINGTEVGSYSTDTRSSITNTNTNWNAAVVHYIGKDNAGNYFDGVLSEPSLVDGSTSIAYSTTDTNGVPIPSQPSATWGTCGIYLKFNDGTSATTLGYDRSGNGNNWTPSGISTTAGVTYDWLTDTPTNNYATLNPVAPTSITGTNITLSAAALRAAHSATVAFDGALSTVQIPNSSLIYMEMINDTASNTGSNYGAFGIVSGGVAVNQESRALAGFWGFGCDATRVLSLNGTTTTTAAVLAANSVCQIAVDTVNNKLYLGINNAWYDTVSTTNGNPSAGTGATASVSLAGKYLVVQGLRTIGWDVNFGQRPFSYTPPTGFKALCTANLPNTAVTTSGTFTGNAAADGPVVNLNGNPLAMTINGNAVTWGTHADKIAGGFKVRTASASYNASGSNTFSVSVSGNPFGDSTHTPNTAQGNP